MSDKAKKKTKGKFWLILLYILLALVIAAGLFYVYIEYHARHFDTVFYQVGSSQVSENLRIIFITDLHMREYGEGNSELLSKVKILDPDLIVIGGDLVTYPDTNYDSMIEFCRKLMTIAPDYSVTGNHENELMYLAGDSGLIEKFSETGMVFLDNADVTLEIGSNKVQLVGVNGGVDSFDKYGGKEEMDSLEEHFDGLRIVIDHVPYAFEKNLAAYDFDLGLAGHVHGGIIRLPKFGGLYSFDEGLFPTYTKGKYYLENGAELIVSAGLGDSFKYPIRFNNNPELSVIDINWY